MSTKIDRISVELEEFKKREDALVAALENFEDLAESDDESFLRLVTLWSGRSLISLALVQVLSCGVADAGVALVKGQAFNTKSE